MLKILSLILATTATLNVAAMEFAVPPQKDTTNEEKRSALRWTAGTVFSTCLALQSLAINSDMDKADGTVKMLQSIDPIKVLLRYSSIEEILNFYHNSEEVYAHHFNVIASIQMRQKLLALGALSTMALSLPGGIYGARKAFDPNISTAKRVCAGAISALSAAAFATSALTLWKWGAR